jgi:hypothetical protein
MTSQEMAIKVVVGKQIVLDMAEDIFWKSVINGRADRMLQAVGRGLEKCPWDGKVPETEDEVVDLIFKWTFPVRVEVSKEFDEDIQKALGIMRGGEGAN